MSNAEKLQLEAPDGVKLAVHRWPAAGASRGRILLVHGLAEHMGRYQHVARAFNSAGFEVTGVELRGHGRSGGRRGHVRSWSDYVADLDAAARTIAGPYALVAHSMGGLVALDHLRGGSQARAVVLSSPLLGVAVAAPAWKTGAARLLSRWLPGLSMSNEIDPTLICSDPQVVEAYVKDPLVFRTVTPRWYTELLGAMERVNAHAEHYALPIYVNLGEDDRIVSVPAAQDFYQRLRCPKQLRTWPGLRHETLNEPAQQQVLDAMIAWLQ